MRMKKKKQLFEFVLVVMKLGMTFVKNEQAIQLFWNYDIKLDINGFPTAHPVVTSIHTNGFEFIRVESAMFQSSAVIL